MPQVAHDAPSHLPSCPVTRGTESNRTVDRDSNGNIRARYRRWSNGGRGDPVSPQHRPMNNTVGRRGNNISPHDSDRPPH